MNVLNSYGALQSESDLIRCSGSLLYIMMVLKNVSNVGISGNIPYTPVTNDHLNGTLYQMAGF